MFTNERQVVCFKSFTNVINFTFIFKWVIFISLSFCRNDNQKPVFIVDFFPFSNDCSVLHSNFGANIVLNTTFISNYIRYKERQFCSVKMYGINLMYNYHASNLSVRYHSFVSISCRVKRAGKCEKDAKTRAEK